MAILLLWLLAGALNEVAACVDNVPAYDEWMQSENLGSLQVHGDNGLLAVMPNYTFSCEGVVKQWIVRWDLEWIVRLRWIFELPQGCEIVFNFHVLRPTGSCSVTSVGKNRMVVKTNQVINFLSIFNVSASDRIQVREGDMVGFAVQIYENSCFFRRLTIAEQDDTYNLLTNEVHYIRESFDPDSITELELECSREHRDDDNECTKATCDRYNLKGRDFRVYYATPLINAVVESSGVQPTTSSETESPKRPSPKPLLPHGESSTQPPPTLNNPSTAKIPSPSSDSKKQNGEQESESNMMIPISVVAATIGGLLIATTGVITILCVCYCFGERKKIAGGQPDFALSENKAYSLQPSPAYDDIKCVNPIYENDEDINMRPAKGIAVHQKKPLRPPQQYSMKYNTAYSTSSMPNTSTTTATAATIAEELGRRFFRSQTPTASVGKYAGNCFIVEDSVYEVPNPSC